MSEINDIPDFVSESCFTWCHILLSQNQVLRINDYICVSSAHVADHTRRNDGVGKSWFSYVFHTLMFHIFKLIVILNNDNKVNTKCSF